ncbi:MAG: sigma-54-dependent Fis family transcriptional regulator [Paludibacteraceae bacterium]|nr:sigma-54-dependent Fis family transcriptional regulator [Paludibacteraceae bacterium]
MDLQKVKQQFNIIGNSPLLNRGIEIATQVAITELSVLITGESGAGKEHFPKIIHHYSSRKHEPYFAINCGAIPEGTIDSELFGHEKGAFTDARSERKGYFEIANKGTLFLDEVGELPLSTQARLLRVLETGEFIRVGSSQVQKTNVRVVAATNLDIPRAIKEGKFREDLYYRLNEVGLIVPALRERKEDIPLLIRKFARDFADKYQMPAISLTEEALEIAKNYYWRGNVRQLKNVVNQISIIERRREITPDILLHYLPRNEQYTGLVAVNPQPNGNNYQDTTNIAVLQKIVLSLNNDIMVLKQQMDELKAQINMNGAKPILLDKGETIEEADTLGTDKRQKPIIEDITTEPIIEEVTPINTHPIAINKIADRDRDREAIKDALEATGGNRKAAAALLGVSERTLYRKLKEESKE